MALSIYRVTLAYNQEWVAQSTKLQCHSSKYSSNSLQSATGRSLTTIYYKGSSLPLHSAGFALSHLTQTSCAECGTYDHRASRGNASYPRPGQT